MRRFGAPLFTARSLRLCRVARDRTIVDLARELHISTGSVSMAESGYRVLTEPQLVAMARALKVSKELLLLDPDDVLRRATGPSA